jgi:sulfoxide reductase catalytic subunit YedY
MLIRRPHDIPSSEITPESLYLDRRQFVGAAGALALGALVAPSVLQAAPGPRVGQDDKLTSEEDATSYNNYYEFGTDKDEPKELARGFKPKPWTIEIAGLVKAPRTLDFDALFKALPVQDKVYRHRCVEAWSMVIPWQGTPLRDVIARCEPLPSAKFGSHDAADPRDAGSGASCACRGCAKRRMDEASIRLRCSRRM